MRSLVFSGVVIWLSIMGNVLFAQDFSWEDIGRENLNCQALLVNAQNSKIIFAGQGGNIIKTDNAGKSWRRVLAIKGRFTDINALVMGKNNFNVIYAATGNGLYQSSNLGERWERIFRGKTELESQCTAALSTAQAIFVGTKAGLFMSKDYGRSWHKQLIGVDSGGVFNLELGAGQNPAVYLAAPSGIFKSLDYGQSWERLFVGTVQEKSEEEPAPADEEVSGRGSSIYFVKADKNNANLLYFSSAKGVYRSLNQGQSWDKLTEYGLLNRDLKMICLSVGSEIYALTSSGAFLYGPDRWIELSIGLAADKFNYLALDNQTNIYIAGEKGIFKSSQNNASNFKRAFLVEEYLKYEPGIRELQEAAINYAEVSSKKISQWRKDAAKKAFFPQINIGLDRNSTDLWHWEGGSTTKADDDTLRRGRDNIDWDVSLSWDLSDLIWNDAQASIDVRSKLMVELRDDILDQVNKLYYERLRVKSELDNLALEDRDKRFQKQLKLEELAASLDALTFGYYSEQLRLLALKPGESV